MEKQDIKGYSLSPQDHTRTTESPDMDKNWDCGILSGERKAGEDESQVNQKEPKL